VRVENTERLRSEVLSIADQIRTHRRRLRESLPVSPSPAKCRACGGRVHCDQARV
jgi:CRISPR/Cas system-associated exonuclease Cas4 (RecB family)